MSFTGKCACGSVTLVVSADAPLATRQCWCRQCQQIAAGGPTNNAIFKADDVALSGPVAHAAWTAASGNTLTFHFCPSCGTQIYAQSSARPHLKTVRFGMLDPGHGLRPEAVIWTSDAPDWAQIDPGLESWPQQPPVPPPPPAEA